MIGRQRGRATNITIPIDEGEQYRMGRLVIRSADPEKGAFCQSEYLESIFPLKQGDLFDVSKIRTAMENYTKLYGTMGFIDFTATPSFDVHDDTHTVDLTFDFDEQKQFFVRRIDFSGNFTTRDRVIRRELLVSEGDIFNNRSWELSLLRLNQLDYFEEVKPTNAELKRNIAQGTVDILLTVKEKGRQSISLTGGVSGLSGSFIGLSYQTNNFLGLGETLTFSTQFRQLREERRVRFYRAVSVRPADFHRLYHHLQPLQVRSVAAGLPAAGPESARLIPASCRTTTRTPPAARFSPAIRCGDSLSAAWA